jgi:alpha-glucosidase
MNPHVVVRALAVGALLLPAARPAAAQTYTVRSPGGVNEVAVAVGDSVTWSVRHRGRALLAPSAIGLTLGGPGGAGGRLLGRGVRGAVRARTRVADTTLRPVVPYKNARVRDRYAELRLDVAGGRRGGYALEVRAYDDGVAYRWVTAFPDSVTVVDETARFQLAAPPNGVARDPARASDPLPPGPPRALVGLDSSFMTHYEPAYRRVSLDSIGGKLVALLPTLVYTGGGPGRGPTVAITESGLASYAGMYLVGDGANGLRAVFPRAALEERAVNDRDVPVTRRAPYLARTAGRRAYPWRVLMVADSDAALLENQLVYQLAEPERLADTGWIRPGKVAWDWWNALDLRGVPFRAGVNTETYEYYVDFAARNRLEYVILDEGWYAPGDLLHVTPGLDMPALVRYAEGKSVGIICWTTWHTLEEQMTPAMDQFRRWGVRGIKVDFMQRDDQRVVDFYARTAREAAARHLLVDFHGAHKPAGLNRTYPNVVSFEAVRGLEHNKWSTAVTATHTVVLPFTRMLAGPMDFTPGALRNAQPKQFRVVFERPMSQGTRAHQLAMYVVYESPLQMLSDSPTEYEREPDVMTFLSAVPTVWDETRALAGVAGEYVAVARRRGAEWYVGAMANDSAHTLAVDLSFLGDGAYEMDAWQDGPNADREGEDYAHVRRAVARGDRLTLPLAPGGGFAARIRPRAAGNP